MRLRIRLAAIAAATLGISFGLAAPQARAATYPTCNTTAVIGTGTAPNVGPTVVMPANNSSSAGIAYCLLVNGDSSSAVALLQETLNVCYAIGQPVLTVDGDFGSHTKTALEDVQRHIGVPADGAYGPVTMGRMLFMHNPSDPTNTACYRS